jgi:hypothetical protein
MLGIGLGIWDHILEYLVVEHEVFLVFFLVFSLDGKAKQAFGIGTGSVDCKGN